MQAAVQWTVGRSQAQKKNPHYEQTGERRFGGAGKARKFAHERHAVR